MLDSLVNLPYVSFFSLIIGFGFLIFVHELGHFLVAKWVGIRCTQFALGFGPSILAWRQGIGLRIGSTEVEYEKRIKAGTPESELGETEYRLNYLPLGGYVKMMGQEDLDPTARSEDPRAFNSRPVWARACVISAGVVMNVIVGLIFFVIAFMAGVKFPPAIVGGVVPNMPAAITYAQGHDGDANYLGLQVGDQITKIDGKDVGDMMDIRIGAALGKADTPIELTVQRPDHESLLTFVMTPVPNEATEGLQAIGILAPLTLKIGAVGPDSEAGKQGVHEGMMIGAVDGQNVADYRQYHQLIMAKRGLPATVSFIDPQTNKTTNANLHAKPMLTSSKEKLPNLLGMVPTTQILGFSSKRSPLEAAGGQVGDLIASLNGHPWPALYDISKLVTAAGTQQIDITVYRSGELVAMDPLKVRKGVIGVSLSLYMSEPIISKPRPDSPTATMNLPSGSRIISINGKAIANWADMQRVLGSLEVSDEPVKVKISYQLNIAGKSQEEATLTITPQVVAQLAQANWDDPMRYHLKGMFVSVVGDNPVEAVTLGVQKTSQYMIQTYLTLVRLVQGTVTMKNLRGPIGIVEVGTQVREQRGWLYFIFFLGLISVNLAVINFLPIPIVDGGLMVFLLIEKLKGSPASPALQVVAMWIGLAFIGAVFVLVTYQDIARLVTGPG